MTTRYTHRNLVMWQRAQALAQTMILLTERLPRTWANVVLARQIVSAVTSVGANIAEGHGRYAARAHRNHLLIARGSLAETDSWLDLLRRQGYISPQEEQPLVAECGEITAMLTSKVRMLDRVIGQSDSEMRENLEDYDIAIDAAPPFPFSDTDYT